MQQKIDTAREKSAGSQREKGEGRFTILTGAQVSRADIAETLELDKMFFAKEYWIPNDVGMDCFDKNPDAYIILRDEASGRVAAYMEVVPISDECYEKIRRGEIREKDITSDEVMRYDDPSVRHSLYFACIVVHPDFNNAGTLLTLFNATVNKFIDLAERGFYLKRMIAQTVTREGRSFSRIFGFKKVNPGDPDCSLCEVSGLPPDFRISTPPTKQLFDLYAAASGRGA